MGNFLSPSGTSGEVSSCIEKHSRQFAELGACVCSPEFYTNGESLATLVDFAQTPASVFELKNLILRNEITGICSRSS